MEDEWHELGGRYSLCKGLEEEDSLVSLRGDRRVERALGGAGSHRAQRQAWTALWGMVPARSPCSALTCSQSAAPCPGPCCSASWPVGSSAHIYEESRDLGAVQEASPAGHRPP